MKTLTYAKEGTLLSPEKNIGVITLNRPEVYNAFSPELIDDFNQVLDEIEKDPEVRAVVVMSASEKAFSAGLDLKVAKGLDPESAKALIEKGQTLFTRIENFDKPFIAAINALALGGGLELAMACDIRIASKEAKMGNPEVGLGLIPGWGGTQRLPRIVGIGRAKELILTGGQITGEEAEKIDLVNKAVPPDELKSQAMWIAAKIAGNAPLALKYAKKAVNLSMEKEIPEGSKFEADACMALFKTEDIQEGITAVFEKRKGKFKGK